MTSILTHLHQYPDQSPPSVTLLYSAKRGPSGALNSILFFKRLSKIFSQENVSSNLSFELFVTDSPVSRFHSPKDPDKPVVQATYRKSTSREEGMRVWYRRFTKEDLINALGPVSDRNGTLAYVCGPPPMTDWAVETMRAAEGMDQDRVLCEKWW